jgi:hypothetical protein
MFVTVDTSGWRKSAASCAGLARVSFGGTHLALRVTVLTGDRVPKRYALTRRSVSQVRAEGTPALTVDSPTATPSLAGQSCRFALKGRLSSDRARRARIPYRYALTRRSLQARADRTAIVKSMSGVKLGEFKRPCKVSFIIESAVTLLFPHSTAHTDGQ